MLEITSEVLKKWRACEEGFKRFCELFPDGASLSQAIDGLVADGHDEWGKWLFDHARNDEAFKDQTLNGYRNSGDWNSGDWNSGYWNSGDWNSGYRNSGDWNSGDRNSGNRNSGDWNSGYRNSGNLNSGDWNSGDWNSGYRNSGDWNSGNRNSGDWNSGNLNSGFFNTNTPDEVLVFNKACNLSIWDAAYKPSFLYFDLTYWVDESEMTDEEKIADPHFHVRGGQLRKRDYKEAFKLSWEKADPVDRMRVKDLPNFDADVFFEISGIRVSDYEVK